MHQENDHEFEEKVEEVDTVSYELIFEIHKGLVFIPLFTDLSTYLILVKVCVECSLISQLILFLLTEAIQSGSYAHLWGCLVAWPIIFKPFFHRVIFEQGLIVNCVHKRAVFVDILQMGDVRKSLEIEDPDEACTQDDCYRE
jgi:hypothetical protein